ncbi:hypothetical protein CNR22_13065 [Sphingobacteriaceae bacterium]|nr:hypothetical protein CNR22_13065 [Sphingobacteriaceae bacterium]
MKSTLLLLATTLIFCFSNAKADGGSKTAVYDKNSCLHVTGIVNSDEDYQDCIVELIGPDKAIDTVMLSQGNEKFEFILKKNSDYLIRISKKGYLNKTVAISTHILTLETEIHFFEFELSLLKDTEIAKLNKNLASAPIALVSYNYQTESFEHNVQYSDLMKKELYNVTASNQTFGEQEKSQTLSTKCHSFLTLSR